MFFTYGPLIHNEAVVQRLEEAGAPYVDSLDEITETEDVAIIVRSHGVAPHVLEAIKTRGFEIIDATCPFVKRIQHKAHLASEEGRLCDHHRQSGPSRSCWHRGLGQWASFCCGQCCRRREGSPK